MQQSTWTSQSPVSGLHLDVPGRVVVARDPSLNATARVDVFTDIVELLPWFQSSVATNARGDTFVKLVLRKDFFAQPRYHFEGVVLVHVTVQAPLSFIDASFHGDTTVHQDALVTGSSEKLTVRAADANSVFLELNRTLRLAKLDLQSDDSGSIQLVTSEGIQVDEALVIDATDSGVVAVQGDLAVASGTLDCTAKDSGRIFVTSRRDQVVATRQSARATDSGRVNLYPRGACDTSTVSAVDGGRVNAGSMACQSVDVDVTDGGKAEVQAVSSLSTHASDGGRVHVFNSTPAVVTSARGVSLVTTNAFDVFAFQPLPSQVARPVKLSGYNFIVAGTPGTDVLGVAALCAAVLLAFALWRRPKKPEAQPLIQSTHVRIV